MNKSVTLIYFNAGGGHRAAALALQEVIQAQKRPWDVSLVNLVDVLDPKGRFRKLTGIAPEDIYNMRLARGWTLGLAQELKVLQGAVRLGHPLMLRALQQHWLRTEPDLVVSLVPNFNLVLCDSVAATLPGVPYVTVLTDLADHPPHFWIEPGLRQHLVCGTPKAVAQARAAGVDPAFISLTSGMVMRPAFYLPAPADRAAACRALGLDPARPIGVVMFGGQGSMQMERIARDLDDVQLILMCGHNLPLAGKLKALRRAAPAAVLGFTPDVAARLRLGDFFIGKPGPGSLSEALHLGLPVITVKNAWTMPQERYNADWVQEQGVGLVLRSIRHVGAAVRELLARLPDFQARVRRLDNRAVYEVPEILADLMHAAAIPVASSGALSAAALVSAPSPAAAIGRAPAGARAAS